MHLGSQLELALLEAAVPLMIALDRLYSRMGKVNSIRGEEMNLCLAYEFIDGSEETLDCSLHSVRGDESSQNGYFSKNALT
jgi:hypothetical protein